MWKCLKVRKQGQTTPDNEPNETNIPRFERSVDGKFRCTWPRCGKEFASSSLSHHRVVHSDQNLRPFVCRHDRCGATYTQLARLITHQRTTHHDYPTSIEMKITQNHETQELMDMVLRREAALTMASIRKQGAISNYSHYRQHQVQD
ncbi:hypothetical protein BGZ76_005010 [Entomortierella beljakovae]|nr:hypothetical protein BGZ76_005010 [Entomortierella beljakovae]